MSSRFIIFIIGVSSLYVDSSFIIVNVILHFCFALSLTGQCMKKKARAG